MIWKESWTKEMKKLEDRTLFDNRWVTVKEIDGWVYLDTPPAVAVLPFRTEDGLSSAEFLIRHEKIPSMGLGMSPWLIFGGVEEHGSPEKAAVEELWEEGGFRVQESDLIPLGEAYTRKDVNKPAHLFAVDVTDFPQVPPVGDGSEAEEVFELEWVSTEGLIDHPASLAHSLLLRLYNYLGK